MMTTLRQVVPVLIASLLTASVWAIPSLRIVDRANQEVTIAGSSFTGDPVTLVEDEVMTVKSPFSKVVPTLLDGSSSPAIGVLRAPGQPEMQGTVQAPKTAMVSGTVVSPGMGGLSYEIPLAETARWDLVECALTAVPDVASHTWTYSSGSLTDIRDRQWTIASGMAFTLGSSSGIPTLRLLWGKGTLKVHAGLARSLALAEGRMQVTLANGVVVSGTAPTDWDGAMGQGEAGEVKLKAAGVKAAQWVYGAQEPMQHSSSVLSVAFSLDGGRIVSCGGDDAMVWDAISRRRLHRITSRGRLFGACPSPDGRSIGLARGDNAAGIWDLGSDTWAAALREHTDWVRSVAFSPDGALLASGSDDASVKLWKTADSRCQSTLAGHGRCVRSVAFSPDGRRLIAGANGGAVRLWDVASATPVTALQGQVGDALSVVFSPDGLQVASASSDSNVRIWDVATGACTATLKGHAAQVRSVAFGPSGELLASASEDKTIKLWDVATHACVATLAGHEGAVNSVAFSPDGKLLASGSEDRTVALWDVATRARIEFRVVESILNAAGAPPAPPETEAPVAP